MLLIGLYSIIFDIFAKLMKNMKLYKILVLLSFSIMMSSCGLFQKAGQQPDDLEYMKNIEETAIQESRKQVTTLQPGDQLLIVVSAADQDVSRIFNQNYSSQQQIRQSSIPGGNTVVSQQPVNGPTYIIDSQGLIDFPVIGKIQASGLSIEEFRDSLSSEVRRYIRNPHVQARITNYKITVLGEVRSPGEYVIHDGSATLLNALGMAGDLTVYGRRDDILVVRNTDGVITKERINLGDASFINSPYYNLKQGDVIYVSPNKTQEQMARRDPNLGAYISAASVLVAIVAMLIRK